jgi:hypothetical protein
MSTVANELASGLRALAQAYTAGDQVAPYAVLWPDPDRSWERAVPVLQKLLPELYVLGTYSPDKRSGPALWLRCIEARIVEGAPPAGTVPIFYLPGLSRESMRASEDSPGEIAPLIELQYRGVAWIHPNGKEWTPFAYLISKLGGLGLEIARDQATRDALAGALPIVMSEKLTQLRGRRLDSGDFNELLAPDSVRLLLQWISDTDSFRKNLSDSAWAAFCQQTRSDFRFDPQKSGPLTAAQLLAGREGPWIQVFHRFSEAPANYPGVVDWLRKASPRKLRMTDTAEVWPELNDREELALKQSLEAAADRPQDEAIQRIIEAEARHSERRSSPWQKLGLSPLATALEPLALVAKMCQKTPGGQSPKDFADWYHVEGWKVDAAALATLEVGGNLASGGAVLGALRAVYLPWLDATARNLQSSLLKGRTAISRRIGSQAHEAGCLILFVDGLRMDVAHRLVTELAGAGVVGQVDWEWSSIPSVTASGKPAVSPIADLVSGREVGEDFATQLAGKTLTPDRFVTALKNRGWQVLGPNETGDPSGAAWTEAGAIDKRGHTDGWKMARNVGTEVNDLVGRIRGLLDAGWAHVQVVTDHGFLLMPGGLPKVELKSFLAENRWGRCAALKASSEPTALTLKWSWSEAVSIASPLGAGCFRASVEYSHGGVSLQEMVTPVLQLSRARSTESETRLHEARWGGARCRVSLRGDPTGMRVDVRADPNDQDSSVLTESQPREIGPDGSVTVFLHDDSDIGRSAFVVVLDNVGKVVDSLPTTIGN